MEALVLDAVTVRYGGVTAVADVSLSLPAGKIVGLIGPNGAGKTSLIDAITGFARSSGAITLGGDRIDHLPAHRRARSGIARTWQGVELFRDLAVRDNLRVATERPTFSGLLADSFRPKRNAGHLRIDQALDLAGISDLADRMPSTLSSGQQKLVGVARALAADARVVLLDEPAAGLDEQESDVFRSHMHRIAESGVTILLVEHDMRLVFGACDLIGVLDRGRLITFGRPDDVRADTQVVAAYLGASAEQIVEELTEP